MDLARPHASRAAVRRLLAFAVAAGLLGAAPAAHAQADDWAVTRPRFPAVVQSRYRAMVERNPEDAQALRRLLEARGRRGLDGLITEIAQKAAARPADANLPHLLGHLYRRAGRTDEALKAYEAALRLDPGRVPVRIAVGEIYRARGQLAEARAAYEQALGDKAYDQAPRGEGAAPPPPSVDPRAPRPGLARATPLGGAARARLVRIAADLAVEAKDAARARALFDELAGRAPNDLALRLDYADALARLGLEREALAQLGDALRRQRGDLPRRLETLKRIGLLHEKLKENPRALAVYREAFALTGRGMWQHKELFERVVAMHRAAESLHALIAACEKDWQTRGFFEWDALARLYEEIGEPQRAVAAYRKACAAERTAVDSRERLIRLLDRLGESAEVLAEYERLIAVAPGESRYQLELAERLFRGGARPKALALLKRCAARFTGDPSVHAALADLYSRWGEQDLALRETELLVRLEPSDDNHLLNLGEHYFQKGQRPRALEIWRRLANTTRKERGLARLAEVLADHDLLVDAIELYRKALKLAPTDPELHRGLALVFERQRRTDQAVVAWELVLQHATKPIHQALKREARAKVVSLLHRSGRLGRRLEEQRWRLMRDPNDADAAYFLVDAYLALGRPEEAEGMLDHLLRRDPKDQGALGARIKVYRARRRHALAIEDLKRLAELAPQRARECYEQMAELSFALQRDADALAFARKALELAPSDAAAHARLADLHEKQEDTERAIAEYRRSIELAPHQFPPYFAAARLLGRLGRPQGAAQLYREVIRRAADDDVVLAAGRKALDLEEYLGTLGGLEREIWPLAFALGRRPVYRRLLVELYDRYAPPLIERAGRGDAAASAELAHLGEHGLGPLLEALADRGSPQQRLALTLLGHFANPGAAPALMRIVSEPPPAPVARRAAFGYGGLSSATELRVLALYAAGRLGDPRVLPDLLKLTNEEDVTLRAGGVWGLGRQADPRAAAALREHFNDKRWEVRAIACLAVGLRRDGAARPALAAMVADRMQTEMVRAVCAHALGLLGDATAVPDLIAALEAGGERVPASAATALGRLADPRGAGPLLRAYFGARPPARGAIMWALARIAAGPGGAPAALPEVPLDRSKPDIAALLARLAPPAPAGAARVLAGRGAELGAGLAAALASPAARGRVLAELEAGGLGALTADQAALPPADRAAVQAAVAQALAGLGPQLVPLLDDGDREVRRRALAIAGRAGLAAAAEPAGRALRDPDRRMRETAVAATAALAARDCGAAGRALRGGARDLPRGAWALRLSLLDAVAQVAATCGLAAPEPALAALADGNGFVREAAVRALGHAPAATALPRLEPAAQDEAPAVRATAATALGAALRAGGAPAARARAVLVRLADDPEPAVRASARAALAGPRAR
ncbi:MAG TPA: HEAT repeat domain-containing protein [Polyangia bacterium]